MNQSSNENNKRLTPEVSSLVVDQLGGTSAVARVCEISTAAVAQWRKSGMPRYRFLFLREKYRTLPFMMRPEIRAL